MKTISRLALVLIPLAPLLPAQSWEVGAGGGYGLYTTAKVTAAGASGSAGFVSGIAASAVFGNQVNRWFGGEARYTYRSDDLKVSSGSTKVTAGAESHAIHYDVLFHATSRESRVRPFLAGGAGVKFYRGTGAEPAYQPLSSLVVLTHAHEAQPLVSAGGGIKFAISRKALFRLDVRDYMTPVPTSLLAAPPNSRIGGWIHDLVFLAGFSEVF